MIKTKTKKMKRKYHQSSKVQQQEEKEEEAYKKRKLQQKLQQKMQQKLQQQQDRRPWQRNQHIQNSFKFSPSSEFDFQMNYIETLVYYDQNNTQRAIHDFYTFHRNILKRYYKERIQNVKVGTLNEIMESELEKLKHYFKYFVRRIDSLYEILMQNPNNANNEKTKLNFYFKCIFLILSQFYTDQDVKQNYQKKIRHAKKYGIIQKPESYAKKIQYSQQTKTLIIGGEKYPTNIIGNEKLYFLVNETGFFSYNMFLYAMYHGIILIGIPLNLSSFDNQIKRPPMQFIEHDLTHLNEMTVTLSNENYFKTFQKCYEFIFKSPKYNLVEKETLIFSLWYILHEKPSILLKETNLIEAIAIFVIELFKVTDLIFPKADFGMNSFFIRNSKFGTKCYEFALKLQNQIPQEYVYLYKKILEKKEPYYFGLLGVFSVPILFLFYHPNNNHHQQIMRAHKMTFQQ
jgi:hypothetical protein